MFVYGRLRLPSRMKTRTLLVELFPRSFCRWRTLPLFGAHLDDLMRWLRNQGYAVASIRNYVNALPELVSWLQRKGISSLAQVSREELQAACTYYRCRKSNVSGAMSILIRFFCEQGIVAEGEPPPPSPTEPHRESSQSSSGYHVRSTAPRSGGRAAGWRPGSGSHPRYLHSSHPPHPTRQPR